MTIEANNFMIFVEDQAGKYGLVATFKDTSFVIGVANAGDLKVGLNTKEPPGELPLRWTRNLSTSSRKNAQI